MSHVVQVVSSTQYGMGILFESHIYIINTHITILALEGIEDIILWEPFYITYSSLQLFEQINIA